jgi:hypothetical protein
MARIKVISVLFICIILAKKGSMICAISFKILFWMIFAIILKKFEFLAILLLAMLLTWISMA